MAKKLKKTLLRSTSNKMLEGVCGGIAAYFDVDASLIRIAWVAVTCFTGFFPGIIAYIVCAIIIPKEGKLV